MGYTGSLMHCTYLDTVSIQGCILKDDVDMAITIAIQKWPWTLMDCWWILWQDFARAAVALHLLHHVNDDVCIRFCFATRACRIRQALEL